MDPRHRLEKLKSRVKESSKLALAAQVRNISLPYLRKMMFSAVKGIPTTNEDAEPVVRKVQKLLSPYMKTHSKRWLQRVVSNALPWKALMKVVFPFSNDWVEGTVKEDSIGEENADIWPLVQKVLPVVWDVVKPLLPKKNGENDVWTPVQIALPDIFRRMKDLVLRNAACRPGEIAIFGKCLSLRTPTFTNAFFEGPGGAVGKGLGGFLDKILHLNIDPDENAFPWGIIPTIIKIGQQILGENSVEDENHPLLPIIAALPSLIPAIRGLLPKNADSDQLYNEVIPPLVKFGKHILGKFFVEDENFPWLPLIAAIPSVIDAVRAVTGENDENLLAPVDLAKIFGRLLVHNEENIAPAALIPLIPTAISIIRGLTKKNDENIPPAVIAMIPPAISLITSLFKENDENILPAILPWVPTIATGLKVIADMIHRNDENCALGRCPVWRSNNWVSVAQALAPPIIDLIGSIIRRNSGYGPSFEENWGQLIPIVAPIVIDAISKLWPKNEEVSNDWVRVVKELAPIAIDVAKLFIKQKDENVKIEEFLPRVGKFAVPIMKQVIPRLIGFENGIMDWVKKGADWLGDHVTVTIH